MKFVAFRNSCIFSAVRILCSARSSNATRRLHGATAVGFTPDHGQNASVRHLDLVKFRVQDRVNERVKELRLSQTEVVVTAPSQQADAFFSGCLTYPHSVLVSSSEPSSVSHRTSRSCSLRGRLRRSPTSHCDASNLGVQQCITWTFCAALSWAQNC